jgi:CRP/FNR family cyclic AMP-dependent transcriptional regulator
MEVADLLRESELFRTLGKDEIALIARSTRLESYKAGQIFVCEGRVGAAFFIIVSGHIEVVKDISGPNTAVVATLGPGQFFGEISTIKHLPRSASVRALEDCQCLLIWRTDFDAFISRFPDAAARIEGAARARLGEAPAALMDDSDDSG